MQVRVTPDQAEFRKNFGRGYLTGDKRLGPDSRVFGMA
jgi:hypothetical protein